MQIFDLLSSNALWLVNTIKKRKEMAQLWTFPQI